MQLLGFSAESRMQSVQVKATVATRSHAAEEERQKMAKVARREGTRVTYHPRLCCLGWSCRYRPPYAW